MLFDQIERIEIALRTQIIYCYCHAYGNNWYEKKELFRKPSFYFGFNELMQKEMAKTSEVSITHYKNKYTFPENPPAWMTLELATFGQLSLLFKNLRSCDAKKEVAKHFGVHPNVLISWLETLAFIRNSCAHHSRLWNRKIPKLTMWPAASDYQWLTQKPEESRLNRIYPALGAIAYLLKRLATLDTFPQKLKELLSKHP